MLFPEVSEQGPVPNGFAGSPMVRIDGVDSLGFFETHSGTSCTLRLPWLEESHEVLAARIIE